MAIERERREGQSGHEIEIIGIGNIGEKARQLIAKADALTKIGFSIPQTLVLAEDFFNGFFQRNGFGESLSKTPEQPSFVDEIRDGSFPLADFKTIGEISSRFPANPLVVRSSAEGDSRGTGIYKSVFASNTPGDLRKAVQEVLAGYFSKDAIAFRKDAKTGEGFGIIIQPLIHQVNLPTYQGELAPLVSGFGYTSTSRGEGYINAVPGLGGGVETRDGERITADLIAAYEGNLASYAIHERGKYFREDSLPCKRSALLQTTSDYPHSFQAQVIGPEWRKKNLEVKNTSIDFSWGSEVGDFFHELNLNKFFKMIQKIERKFGQPQYFEWAITVEKGKPRFWIVQIADIDKKSDMFDFESFGKPLLEAHTVSGSGVAECDKVVICPARYSLDSLADYNLEHQNYVLLYSSYCTSEAYLGERMRYDDVSNSAVVLEIQDKRHAFSVGNPLNHWTSGIEMSGKLFGVIEDIEDNPFLQEAVEKGTRDERELIVYDRKLRIVSSERQNRLTVFEREDSIK